MRARCARLLAISGLLFICFQAVPAAHSWWWSKEKTYEKRITKKDYEKAWPLKVNSGILQCVNPYSYNGASYGEIVFKISGGLGYGLNGKARGRKVDGFNKYSNIDELRRDDPSGRIWGLMSVQPLIDAGLKLCR